MIGLEAGHADHHAIEPAFPHRNRRLPVQPIRIGVIRINRRMLDICVLISICYSLQTNVQVKVAGLAAQLIAVIIVVAETPVVCVVFGILAFLFGITEGIIAFMRAFGR